MGDAVVVVVAVVVDVVWDEVVVVVAVVVVVGAGDDVVLDEVPVVIDAEVLVGGPETQYASPTSRFPHVGLMLGFHVTSSSKVIANDDSKMLQVSPL